MLSRNLSAYKKCTWVVSLEKLEGLGPIPRARIHHAVGGPRIPIPTGRTPLTVTIMTKGLLGPKFYKQRFG